MRFLFTTLQTYETAFYGQVGRELERFGHEVEHVSVSAQAARLLREQGARATALPDLLAAVEPHDVDAERARIERVYGLPSIRELYRADWPSERLGEEEAVARTVRHVLAFERHLDETKPDVLVPEVGSEVVRRAAHAVALGRGITTLLLFYTIFPNPLRLYVDRLHAPIVAPEEVRELTPDERAELEAFRAEFTARAEPIRRHRRISLHPRRLGVLAGHVRRRLTEDRENPYLRPGRLLALDALGLARGTAARLLYQERRPGRPFVFFPLHVTADYKITSVLPWAADQAALVEQVADALPPGYDVVVKEHPMAIGADPLSFLRRLRRRRNVRLVDPHTSAHELIRESRAVAVISSTVGLEALLYAKPVLTIGEPFYSGYGVTLDVSAPAELWTQTAALLRFRPDPERIDRFLHAAMRACRPGAPVLVDRSDENAALLAASLDAAAREVV